MKKSLLGHLYSHIKGSAEDVATMSLQYILNSYDALREEFNKQIGNRLQTFIDKGITYECQSIGEEKERPDMSGNDASGKRVILCEVKFYAGLTSNQPLTYLRRLKEHGGAGLVIICPKDRMISLWETLMGKCKNHELAQVGEYCCRIDGVPMALLCWEEILTILTNTANAVAKDSLGDIEQLRGYFEQIVSNSFLTVKAEDLGADEAKKYERLMYIVDRVVDALCADEKLNATTKNLKATPYRHGYKRYLKANNRALDLRIDLEAWADDRYIDTPMWLGIQNRNWETPKSYIDAVNGIHPARKRIVPKDYVFLAIDIPCNAVEEEVIGGVKRQILEYLELFDGLE